MCAAASGRHGEVCGGGRPHSASSPKRQRAGGRALWGLTWKMSLCRWCPARNSAGRYLSVRPSVRGRSVHLCPQCQPWAGSSVEVCDAVRLDPILLLWCGGGFFFFFFNSLLMFSKSLNKVRCVNSLINNVKMELTACGYLGSTIACQPTLPPYKSCPAVFPLFRAQSANQSFVEAEGQPAPFCGATAAGRPRGGLRWPTGLPDLCLAGLEVWKAFPML